MLGTAIRQAREEKGMSQERLAEELGVSRQAVSKWEIEQSVPTPRNLEGIEAALDLPAGTLAELLKEEEREPSSPKISKKCILLTSVVGVAVLVMAFSLGWFVSQQSSASHGGELSPGNGQVTMNFQSPQGAIDAAVTVPTQEDGTVLFDMPLSSPGEEERLARQLEYHQWPDHLELECSELADGYCIYTLPEEIDELSVPEGYFFLFYEPDRAFGFSYEFGTKWYLDEYAPVYDRLSPGFLWRRDGVQDTRTQGGAIGGTTVTFMELRPDELIGWTPDGTPMPTPREQGALLLEELEALSGYRPERCYLWGGIESQQVAIDRDGDHRSFFYMSYDLPNYNSRWVLVDYSSFIPNINLQWQSEWAPWSPMRKDAVNLPGEWADMTEEQRALWWYRKSSYFDYGEVASIGPAQYEGVVKLTMADDSFLEVTLDEDGFLTSIYGPYPPGTIH